MNTEIEERFDAMEMRQALIVQLLATIAGGLAGTRALGDGGMNGAFAALERYGHVSEAAYTESRVLRGMMGDAMR